jgi:hypothetical protein
VGTVLAQAALSRMEAAEGAHQIAVQSPSPEATLAEAAQHDGALRNWSGAVMHYKSATAARRVLSFPAQPRPSQAEAGLEAATAGQEEARAATLAHRRAGAH